MKLGQHYKFMLPAIIFTSVLGLFPLIYTFYLSFHRYNPIYNKIPSFVGFDRFGQMWTDPLVHYGFFFTLALVGVTITMQAGLGLGIALLLNRDSKMARIARSLIIIPMVSIPVVTAATWRYMLSWSFGPITYLLTLLGFPRMEFFTSAVGVLFSFALIETWQTTPFIALIVGAGLFGLRQDVYEAASLDGASGLNMLRHITLPMLKGILAIALALRTIDALKVFDNIFIITSGGPGRMSYTLSMVVYLEGFKFWNLGYAAAVSIAFLGLSAIIGGVIFIFFRKELTGTA